MYKDQIIDKYAGVIFSPAATWRLCLSKTSFVEGVSFVKSVNIIVLYENSLSIQVIQVNTFIMNCPKQG